MEGEAQRARRPLSQCAAKMAALPVGGGSSGRLALPRSRGTRDPSIKNRKSESLSPRPFMTSSLEVLARADGIDVAVELFDAAALELAVEETEEAVVWTAALKKSDILGRA